MSTTQMESKNETKDVRQEVQDLRKAIEVQAATEAGAHATQAATHAGTWSRVHAFSRSIAPAVNARSTLPP